MVRAPRQDPGGSVAAWPDELQTCLPETGIEVRQAALSRLGEALGAAGVRWHPAPGGKLVLSLWPGLHAGVSLDATRYGWTERELLVTWPADDVTGAAHMIAQRLDILTGAQRWRP